MFENIKADFKRYKTLEGASLLYVLCEQGLWAIIVYRFGRWARGVKFPVISWILKLLAFFLFKWVEILTGISLPASAEIGKGFYVGHFGGIILHSAVKIGENGSIGPGVLIGTRGGGNKGVPVIGRDVYIGVGAKILGGIKIGDRVKIGANAVVINDVPNGSTAVGIPARVLKEN